jgi:hypothetical protein
MVSGSKTFPLLLAAAAFVLAAWPVHAADEAAAVPDEPEIVFREDPSREDEPLIQGFRLPEYDGEGRLKRQATGDTARFLQDGLLEVTGLELSLYEEGSLQLVATSPRCVYDQGKHRAASREPLRVVTDTAVLTGNGFAWNGEAEQFQIFDHARLVIDTTAYDAEDALGFPAGGGADGAPGNNEESEK